MFESKSLIKRRSKKVRYHLLIYRIYFSIKMQSLNYLQLKGKLSRKLKIQIKVVKSWRIYKKIYLRRITCRTE